jgi:hypothetical protein
LFGGDRGLARLHTGLQAFNIAVQLGLLHPQGDQAAPKRRIVGLHGTGLYQCQETPQGCIQAATCVTGLSELFTTPSP